MKNNLAYENNGYSNDLAELTALRQILSTNLSSLNHGLNKNYSETDTLKRRNELLKNELNRQNSLINTLYNIKQLPSLLRFSIPKPLEECALMAHSSLLPHHYKV